MIHTHNSILYIAVTAAPALFHNRSWWYGFTKNRHTVLKIHENTNCLPAQIV